jgi:hypothetical protein
MTHPTRSILFCHARTGSSLFGSLGWEGTTGRVVPALGLERAPLHTTIRPPWNRSHSEMITNYAELVETARAAGYGHF